MEENTGQLSNFQIWSWASVLKIRFLDAERRDEVYGIAQAAGISYNKLLIANFMYEQYAYCTSVIAR